MDWATQKKLKYYILGIMIIVAIIFFFLLSYLNRPATCSDKKQNGTETGVDCGGTCQYLCLNGILPIEIEWARALPSGPKRVNLVAYISNQNPSAAATTVPYKFTLYDKDGKIIETLEGETEILANRNVPIFAGPVDVGERKVQSVTFDWLGSPNYYAMSERALSTTIVTEKTKYEVATSSTYLSATLKNISRNELKNIPVIALVYDKDDNAVLVSKTVVDTLGKEATGEAVFYWNTEGVKEYSKIEIVPLVNDR